MLYLSFHPPLAVADEAFTYISSSERIKAPPPCPPSANYVQRQNNSYQGFCPSATFCPGGPSRVRILQDATFHNNNRRRRRNPGSTACYHGDGQKGRTDTSSVVLFFFLYRYGAFIYLFVCLFLYSSFDIMFYTLGNSHDMRRSFICVLFGLWEDTQNPHCTVGWNLSLRFQCHLK